MSSGAGLASLLRRLAEYRSALAGAEGGPAAARPLSDLQAAELRALIARNEDALRTFLGAASAAIPDSVPKPCPPSPESDVDAATRPGWLARLWRTDVDWAATVKLLTETVRLVRTVWECTASPSQSTKFHEHEHRSREPRSRYAKPKTTSEGQSQRMGAGTQQCHGRAKEAASAAAEGSGESDAESERSDAEHQGKRPSENDGTGSDWVNISAAAIATATGAFAVASAASAHRSATHASEAAGEAEVLLVGDATQLNPDLTPATAASAARLVAADAASVLHGLELDGIDVAAEAPELAATPLAAASLASHLEQALAQVMDGYEAIRADHRDRSICYASTSIAAAGFLAQTLHSPWRRRRPSTTAFSLGIVVALVLVQRVRRLERKAIIKSAVCAAQSALAQVSLQRRDIQATRRATASLARAIRESRGAAPLPPVTSAQQAARVNRSRPVQQRWQKVGDDRVAQAEPVLV